MKLLGEPRQARFLPSFEEGLKKIKDPIGRAAIVARIKRAERGNFGDYKLLAEGISELRIDVGPGYRVYFAIGPRDELIILLLVGTKGSQRRDIRKAIKIWKEFIL